MPFIQAAPLILTRAGFLPEERWQSMHPVEVLDLYRRRRLYGYVNFYIG
jgi:hypothetical protein